MAFCATGILPAIGQSQGNAAAIAQAGTTIGVYSGRHYNTDKELYRQFTARTGIKVNVLEAKDDALLERLKSEGKNSPADVLVLVDAARALGRTRHDRGRVGARKRRIDGGGGALARGNVRQQSARVAPIVETQARTLIPPRNPRQT